MSDPYRVSFHVPGSEDTDDRTDSQVIESRVHLICEADMTHEFVVLPKADGIADSIFELCLDLYKARRRRLEKGLLPTKMFSDLVTELSRSMLSAAAFYQSPDHRLTLFTPSGVLDLRGNELIEYPIFWWS